MLELKHVHCNRIKLWWSLILIEVIYFIFVIVFKAQFLFYSMRSYLLFFYIKMSFFNFMINFLVCKLQLTSRFENAFFLSIIKMNWIEICCLFKYFLSFLLPKFAFICLWFFEIMFEYFSKFHPKNSKMNFFCLSFS